MFHCSLQVTLPVLALVLGRLCKRERMVGGGEIFWSCHCSIFHLWYLVHCWNLISSIFHIFDLNSFEMIVQSHLFHDYFYWKKLDFHHGLLSSVQSLSRVQLFAAPWTAPRHASLSITNSWQLLKLMSIESVMPSSHLILCHPLLLPLQSFPTSGSFPVSQFFTSGGQSIGASASVLPVNIQDWLCGSWRSFLYSSSVYSCHLFLCFC